MPALRKSLPLILALTFLGQSGSLQAEPRQPGVGGRVFTESTPLSSVRLYAYQLADLSLSRAMTDGRGISCSRTSRRGSTRSSRTRPGSCRWWSCSPARPPRPTSTSRSSSPSGRPAKVAREGGRLTGPSAPGAGRRPAPDRDRRERGRPPDRPVRTPSAAIPLGSRSPATSRTEMQALTGVDQIAARRRPDVRRRRRRQGAARDTSRWTCTDASPN